MSDESGSERRILTGIIQTVTGNPLNPNISPPGTQPTWVATPMGLVPLVVKFVGTKKCPRSEDSDRGLGRRTGEGGSRSRDYVV